MAGLLLSAGFLAAQAIQGHPEDYSRADIEYGARVYSENCDRCHGPNGTGVSGVDFKSGKFSHATTDRQLMGVITTGFPEAGISDGALLALVSQAGLPRGRALTIIGLIGLAVLAM